MCGIAAALSTDPAMCISKNGIESMGEALAHRGPDDAGVFFSASIALAHRRLSIIDLEDGQQPTHYQSLSMVYNGELYNCQEIKKELVDAGIPFFSNCDTEVVIKAFSHWGEAAFKRFNGMFALIIIDHQQDLVVVARDRFGIKPLYVGDDISGCRLFSSEMSALVRYQPGKHQDWSGSALLHYLRLGYYLEPDTPRHNVRQVLPGTYEIHRINGKGWEEKTYWDPAESIQLVGPDIAQEEGQALLSNAVRRQMIADVPVGSFLSGGLDSALVSSLASHSDLQFQHAFSAGFSASQYDESEKSKVLAEYLGLEHHCLSLEPSMLNGVKDIPGIYGGPFADNAALPTYYLSKMASKHVKVVLSGDGADELFFGYRNHRALFAETALKGLLPGWLRDPVLRWIAEWYPNHPFMPRVLRAQSTLRSLSLSLAEGYCSAMSVISENGLQRILSPDFLRRHDQPSSEQRFMSIAANCEHNDPMKIMQYLDLKTYLPGSVLTKVDRATMRSGIEARVPFLDNELSERVLSQGSTNNLGWGQHKTQLRRWAYGRLPEEARMRVKKSFTSPLDNWLRGLHYSVFSRMIMSENLIDSGVFDIDELQQLMDSHYNRKANYGTVLWSIAVLSKTLQQEGGVIR